MKVLFSAKLICLLLTSCLSSSLFAIHIKFVAWGATDKIDKVIIRNVSRESNVIEVLGSGDLTLGCCNMPFKIYPYPHQNPFEETTTISFYSTGESATIMVFNILGQQVATERINPGSETQSFNLTTSAPGHYFVRILQGAKIETVKVLCSKSGASTCTISKTISPQTKDLRKNSQVNVPQRGFNFVKGDWLEYCCFSGDRMVKYFDCPKENNTIKFFFNPYTQEERLAWWKEAKLGLFIHWGIYSALEGEWNGKLTKTTGIGAEWIKRLLNVPNEEYNKYLGKFDASQFSPQAIADLAKRNGLKYVVITVKHHDGFILFPSKISDYNITRTPANPELIKELADACRAVGLKFGVYYSQNMDWTHRGGFDMNTDYGYHVNNGKGWTLEENYDYLTQNSIPVLEEIFTNYDPDILWYDIPWIYYNPTWAQLMQNKVYELSKGKVIINDRLHALFQNDFDTPEGHWTKEYKPDNEICFTMNGTWGYDKHSTEYISTHSLLYKLIESASRGGNSLVNIGPKADGSVPQEQITLLDNVGKWLNIYGSSLYGTSIALPSTHQCFGRLTQKQDTVYAHILNPQTKSIRIDGILNHNILSISDFRGNKYTWTKVSDETTDVSEINPNSSDVFNVLKIVFDGKVKKTDRLSINTANTTFHALCFKGYDNPTLSFKTDDVYIGNWNPETRFKTTIYNNYETGKYNVYIKVQGGNYTSLVKLKVNDVEYQGIDLALPPNYDWDNYSFRLIQTIDLEKDTEYKFELYKDGDGKYLNLSTIKFEKIN